jgi:type I restriction enzyme S subunit
MPEVITDNLDLWTSALLTKSTAGRGSNGKLETYGIKKLRELILELAVRGKLVPQDPNDEPASVLLEKITHEKARLNKEGRIRKQEKKPSITDSEKPFYIPSGWEWVRLGDVVEIVRGITFPASEKSRVAEEGRVACLRTTNVQDRIEWDDLLYVRREFVTRDEQFVRVRDIVMSTANSRELVGKVAIVEKEPELQAAFGGFLTVLRPILLDPSFVMVLLRTPVSRNALIDRASQTTNIANISIGKLNPLVLAIPPLAEQHRIVAKVDELMALCDQLEQHQTHSIKAHQTLVETLLGTLTRVESQQEFSAAWARIASHFDTLFTTTEASIDQLKQTILQLAVMGKLAPQDPNDEDVQILLTRSDLRRCEVAESDRRADAGSQPILSADDRWEIPEAWAWRGLADLVLFVDYRGKTPAKLSSGIRLLTAKNVRRGHVDLFPEEFLSEEDYTEWMTRGFPQVGDVLFTTEAPMGNAAVVDLNERFALAQRVICFQGYGALDPAFLVLQILSSQFQFILDKNGTGMTAKGIKASKLKQLPVAIPPLAEQHRIVAKVDELMALCDALKVRLADAQTTQLHLADAIVEQAVC